MSTRVIALLLFSAVTSLCQAQVFGPTDYDTARQYYGFRRYYNYPYYYSYGPRYDPYWSYKSSYYPESYGGDGSYYGIGYSPNYGDGWYGTYWYW